MRIAVISDIHGNLVAFETVLDRFASEGIDQIVCLGDVAAGAAQPAGTVARLRAIGGPVVMGNADAETLDPASIPAIDETTRQIKEITAWAASQLAADDLAYLRSFQPTVEVPLGDAGLLLGCHGSPRSFDDQIVAAMSPADVDAMLAEIPPQTTIVASGHTHLQGLRRYRHLLLLNPGSVGLPFHPAPPSEPVCHPAWAEYAIVTTDRGAMSVELCRVPIDLDDLSQITLGSNMPDAGSWIASWRA